MRDEATPPAAPSTTATPATPQANTSPATPQAATTPATTPPPDQTPSSRTPKRAIAAWALWDWGSAAFNAVIVTFVFAPYLTSGVAGDPDSGAAALGWATSISGLLVAVLAPAAGVRADALGTHRKALASYTMVVVGIMLAMFFIRNEPAYFIPGLILLGLGQLVFELAEVSYNGMLTRISHPGNAGTISALGWGLGYLGGLVLLSLMLFLFIQPEVGLFGVGDDGGLRYRAVAFAAGIWFLLFALPVFLFGPAGRPASARTSPALLEQPSSPAQALPNYYSADTSGAAAPGTEAPPANLSAGTSGAAHHQQPAAKVSAPEPGPADLGWFESWKLGYLRVFRRFKELFQKDRSTFVFLIASAVFRDGLATIFAMAGVLATGAYGFSGSEVIFLGVAANLVAGLGSLLAGRIDDWVGPKAVIVTGLVCLILGALPILLSDSKLVFWVAAMWLCLFVGPVQSSSRSFLSRITPAERAGENFGLYATTGRAVSFMGPALFALTVTIFNFQRAGALGIMAVLGLGLALMLLVPNTGRIRQGA